MNAAGAAGGMIAVAMADAVAARCLSIVARTLHLLRREVGLDDEFGRDLAADSIDMVTITMAAEEEFGIEIRDAAAASCSSVADMVDLIERKMAGGA